MNIPRLWKQTSTSVKNWNSTDCSKTISGISAQGCKILLTAKSNNIHREKFVSYEVLFENRTKHKCPTAQGGSLEAQKKIYYFTDFEIDELPIKAIVFQHYLLDAIAVKSLIWGVKEQNL